MSTCYLCGDILDASNQHDEHILQNALGGKLKSNDILCEACGGILGDKIDVPFIKIFTPFTERIQIIRDRGSKGGRLTGELIDHPEGPVTISYKNFKATPLKPYAAYDEKSRTLLIYGNSRTAKQYESVARKQYAEKQIDTVKIVDDLTGMLKFGFTMDNGTMKAGLSKIAVGFAAKAGISREALPLSLDCNNKEIIYDKNILPYLPLGDAERLIEILRPTLDGYYPCHILILFSQKISKTEHYALVCYVELFGTFQYYVILNKDYKGAPVYETYLQSILKEYPNNLQISFLSPKDALILADQYNIGRDELTGKSMDEIKEIIERRSKLNPPYEKNIVEWLGNILSKLITGGMLSQLRKKIQDQSLDNLSIMKEICDQINDISEQELILLFYSINQLFYKLDSTNQSDLIMHKKFRIYYINFKEVFKAESGYYIDDIPHTCNDSETMLIEYNHMKFYSLCDFIERHIQENKFS